GIDDVDVIDGVIDDGGGALQGQAEGIDLLGGAVEGVVGEAAGQDLRVGGGDADGPRQQVVGRVVDHGARALHAGAVGLVHLHGARQGVVGNAGDRPDRVDDLQDTAVSVIDGGRGALQAAHAVGVD